MCRGLVCDGGGGGGGEDFLIEGGVTGVAGVWGDGVDSGSTDLPVTHTSTLASSSTPGLSSFRRTSCTCPTSFTIQTSFTLLLSPFPSLASWKTYGSTAVIPLPPATRRTLS